MKVLGINGSPRIDGNTFKLVNQVLSGAMEKNAETKIINLEEKNISGCISCYYCRKTGSCSIKDDMEQILKEIYESDAIVIGSPVYMWQMTAQTKLFVDRLLPVLKSDFTSRFEIKKDLVLAFTQGDPNIDSFMDYFEKTKAMFNFLGFNVREIIVAAGTRDKNDIMQKQAYLDKARYVGSSLIS